MIQEKLIYYKLFFLSFLILVFLFPILFLIVNFIQRNFQFFNAININFLIKNLLMFILIIFFSIFFGFITAWHDVFHNFCCKKFINCLIISSLAFPSYINAFIYVKIFEKFGLLYHIGLPKNFFFDFRTETGYIITMIASFYPYSYIIFKINLPKIKSLILLGKTCNLSMKKFFLEIILPLQKPIIIGISIVILMELLADFGVANELAINNFSTILYKKWFIQYNQTDAIKNIMQILLVLFIIFLFLIKRKQNTLSNHSYYMSKIKKNHFIFITSIILVVFSFFLPLLCTIYWALLSLDCKHLIIQLPKLTFNTIFITIVAAIILIFFSLIINFIYIFSKKNNLLKLLIHLPYLTYCIPGIIIVISTMMLNKYLTSIMNNPNIMHVLQNSFFLLIYVYCIRFLSISLNTIGNDNNVVNENSRILTKIYNIDFLKKFFIIYLPLIKNNIIFAFLFISSEIIKELPLTLIIRPFNFETLATKVNNLVSEERYNDASLPSLIIVGLEIILIYSLQRKKRDGNQ